MQFDPESDFYWLLAVLLIPLVGYAIQISLRKRLPWGDKLLTAGMGVSALITVWVAMKAIAGTGDGQVFSHHSSEAGLVLRWFYQDGNIGEPQNVLAGILYDGLAAAMLAVVGIVSFCVHLFSRGYMQGDKRYNIFFANLSLFTFAMLGLVLADNILFFFIFWELMGLMSYLLIGHFSHDPSQPFFHRWATWASKKAFLTTRVGDVCLFIGIFMFYDRFDTLVFTELWEKTKLAVEANGGDYPAWMTVAGLFIFGGTIGKSAQFPLHIWLPDAMAGPTPVSAMIHAATMVAAGVFLLGRTFPLMTPEALSVVTAIGAFTALFAATIGLTAYDLKAVLAYSTISQLGFMVAAAGLGGVVAGMFHMTTHAFFKACLFLSAGSVIHGCHHVQDMRLMGGLRKKLPVTFWCMLICTMAISGVPFFSGFYSKDMILLSGWANILDSRHFDGWAVFSLLCLAIAAAMTAFYMFRLIFMTFFGEYRGNLANHMYSAAIAAEGVEGPDPHEHAHDDHGSHDDHGHEPHEDPLWRNPMTIALCILTLFAVPGAAALLNHGFTELVTLESLYGVGVAGFLAEEWITEGIHDLDSHIAHASHTRALIVSVTVATAGIVGAWFLYVRRRDLPGKFTEKFPLLYKTVRRKYYFDELVDAAVIRPTMALAKVQRWIDEHVIDGFVLLVGRVNKAGGFFAAWVDKTFVDGAVNAVGMISQGFGSIARLFQTGRIQQYAAFAVGGGLLTAAWLILS